MIEIIELPDDPIVPSAYNALTDTLKGDHVEDLRQLLAPHPPTLAPDEWKELISWCGFHDSPHCLQELLQLAPLPLHPHILLPAAVHGHAACIQLMIHVTDPKANASEALRAAAQSNHFDVVSKLLPHSDIHANNYEVLYYAIYHDNRDAIDEICSHVRPSLLSYLTPDMVDFLGFTHKYAWEHFEHTRKNLLKSETLKQTLQTTLPEPSRPSKVSKI